ncbi:MAG: 7-carboxy-7-deazaguanine synthase [Promethearchaeota archaeon]|nr:MAG: 7-carboxy-7-deazaguanine synthase [Candidatus Lokiarchaeota archaeon]
MKETIVQSLEGNYFINKRGIPKGCELCLLGTKAVLFLNGLCQKPQHCAWYCPLSQKRRNKDIAYINELQITGPERIFTEIQKMDAKGLSITGGEPLLSENLHKTLKLIKLIKKRQGKSFHIHLYTNGIHFTQEIARNLYKTGLDEIRFHPPKNKWTNIALALQEGLHAGAEVPLIPAEPYISELKKFVMYLDKIGAPFINLNEFEYCFPNSSSLKKKGFLLEQGTIASVKGTKDAVLRLLTEMAPSTTLKLHFCSIRAKDYFQLKERYLRRAKHVKRPFEEITEEGLLLYAQIEGDREPMDELKKILLKDSGMPRKYVSLTENAMKLPYYIVLDNNFQKLLKPFKLQTFIIECLPFDEDEEIQHRHVTEKIPLALFKKEYEFSP